MCRKNFENRFTNKTLTPKNVFEQGFLHGEIITKGSHFFPGKKIKSFNILLKMQKATSNSNISLPGVDMFE